MVAMENRRRLPTVANKREYDVVEQQVVTSEWWYVLPYSTLLRCAYAMALVATYSHMCYERCSE